MHNLLIWQNNAVHDDRPTSVISELLVKADAVIWLDICDPTKEDFALLSDEFGFHPLAIEDALPNTERPKIDMYDKYYFTMFYAASVGDEDNLKLQSLALFIGHNYLVTVHADTIPQVDRTMELWKIPNSPLKNKVASLAHALLDMIVDDYSPVMDHIVDRIEDVEFGIFEKFDEQLIETIFDLKKVLLDMRRILAPERDIMNVLLRRELQIFKTKDIVYLQDVYDHIVRVIDNIDIYRDMLSTALDSYLSIQSNNLNQIVKVLTVASIILMANALISSIYGMNFINMPELHWKYGYFYALGLMLFISLGLFLYFRLKKLL